MDASTLLKGNPNRHSQSGRYITGSGAGSSSADDVRAMHARLKDAEFDHVATSRPSPDVVEHHYVRQESGSKATRVVVTDVQDHGLGQGDAHATWRMASGRPGGSLSEWESLDATHSGEGAQSLGAAVAR